MVKIKRNKQKQKLNINYNSKQKRVGFITMLLILLKRMIGNRRNTLSQQ